jgi:hypothetical protein
VLHPLNVPAGALIVFIEDVIEPVIAVSELLALVITIIWSVPGVTPSPYTRVAIGVDTTVVPPAPVAVPLIFILIGTLVGRPGKLVDKNPAAVNVKTKDCT